MCCVWGDNKNRRRLTWNSQSFCLILQASCTALLQSSDEPVGGLTLLILSFTVKLDRHIEVRRGQAAARATKCWSFRSDCIETPVCLVMRAKISTAGYHAQQHDEMPNPRPVVQVPALLKRLIQYPSACQLSDNEFEAVTVHWKH